MIQIASIIGLRECLDFPAQQSAIYAERRDALIQGLSHGDAWPGLENPRAGMFLWAKIPEEFQSMGSLDFSLQMMEEAEVALSPGIGFGPEGEGYVRMAFIENPQRIQQAARQIRRTLSKWRTEGAPKGE